MLKYEIMKPLMRICLSFFCFSLISGFADEYRFPPSSQSTSLPQGVKPGVSDDSANYQQPTRQFSNREKIAQLDYRDEDIHERADRRGDWDYKENWRYDRRAFYSGETQGEAYRKEHPPGRGGIGYDADDDYPGRE